MRIEGTGDGRLITDVVERRARRELTQPTASSPTPASAPEEASPFARILRSLGREVDRGETVVNKATAGAGKDLGTAELIALQAGVYRYSEAVDLSAKLVDRATSGVKTVLQGQ